MTVDSNRSTGSCLVGHTKDTGICIECACKVHSIRSESSRCDKIASSACLVCLSREFHNTGFLIADFLISSITGLSGNVQMIQTYISFLKPNINYNQSSHSRFHSFHFLCLINNSIPVTNSIKKWFDSVEQLTCAV